MRKIAIVMKRKPLAEGISMALQKYRADGIKSCIINDYELTHAYFESIMPDAALIEISESGKYDAQYCIELCRTAAMDFPETKLILMCPDNDEKSIAAAIEAKKNDVISDFVFYDASMEYLVAKLCSV